MESMGFGSGPASIDFGSGAATESSFVVIQELVQVQERSQAARWRNRSGHKNPPAIESSGWLSFVQPSSGGVLGRKGQNVKRRGCSLCCWREPYYPTVGGWAVRPVASAGCYLVPLNGKPTIGVHAMVGDWASASRPKKIESIFRNGVEHSPVMRWLSHRSATGGNWKENTLCHTSKNRGIN